MTITIPINPRRKRSVYVHTEGDSITRIVVHRPTGREQWSRITSSAGSISIRLGRYNWHTLLKYGQASTTVLSTRFLFKVSK